MHCRMQAFAFIFIAIALAQLIAASNNCKCNRKLCRPQLDCTHGLVWDHCHCCRVCARREGETCGGKRYINGECGRSYECVVRNRRNYLNRYKDKSNELTGRCEPYSCAFERCPFGQRCYTKDGYTHCGCNINCSGMLKEAVCGDTNKKFYKNECELRKDECRLGRRIGVSLSPCPGSNVAVVSCDILRMKIELDRKLFGRRRPRSLVLNDPSCKATVNRTHVTASTFLNGCGTKKDFTLTSIIYSNTLRTIPPKNALIRRGKKVDIPFRCEFVLRSKNRNRARFTLIRPPIQKSFESGKHTKALDGGIYVEVDTTRNYTVILKTLKYKGLRVKLVPFHCYATPLDSSFGDARFVILKNGCPSETNVAVKSASDSTLVLQVPGIRFKNAKKSGTNIRCRVRLCFQPLNENSSDCEMNCLRKNEMKRRRRSLKQQRKSSFSFVSIRRKPIFIQESTE